MAASYPGALKTFTTQNPGDPILSAHINDIQAEVVAVETQLGINAFAGYSWTPTFTGFSVNPSGNYKYYRVNKLVFCNVYMYTAGTSNDTTFTMTLPFTASGTFYFDIPYITDNGLTTGINGFGSIAHAGNVVVLYTGAGASGWTASGAKRAMFQFFYEVAAL